MLDKLDALIISIGDSQIKNQLVALAESVRPKDYLRINIRELEGLIDPSKVGEIEPLGRVEIKL